MKSNSIAAFVVTVLVSLLVYRTCRAGSVSIVQVNNGGRVDDQLSLVASRTFDILLDSPGTNILSQQMRVILTSGSILQHPFGSNVSPNALLIGSFPALEFDSFVAAGGDNSNSPTPTIVGKSDQLGGTGGVPSVFNSNEIDILWGPALGQDTANKSDYLSARLTFSGDAQGTFHYRASFGDGPQVLTEIPIEFGFLGFVNVDPPPDINDFEQAVGQGEIVSTTITENTGLDPTTWADLFYLSYTPGFGAKPTAPGLNLPPSWDPDTQFFSWDTSGSTAGTYLWRTAATNSFGEDFGFITIHVLVPEPATISLLGLALLGVTKSFGRSRQPRFTNGAVGLTTSRHRGLSSTTAFSKSAGG